MSAHSILLLAAAAVVFSLWLWVKNRDNDDGDGDAPGMIASFVEAIAGRKPKAAA